MGRGDYEIDLAALKLMQGVLRQGYLPQEALSALRRNKAPKHFDTRNKIYIFKKICAALARQTRKNIRGPRLMFSLSEAYKDLAFNKKFKKLIEKRESKKYNTDSFKRFLEYVWKNIPIDEKVINILKKKPPKGILAALPRNQYRIQLAEKIRIQLEDKQKNRRKSHYSD
jgi:hypothetical protein